MEIPANADAARGALLQWLIRADASADDLRELTSDPPQSSHERDTAFDLVFAPAGASPS